MSATRYGFRVLGGPFGERRLIDYHRAYTAYCRADPGAQPEITAYLSAFTYGDQFRSQFAATGSVRDYHGPIGVPSVKWDLDREADLKGALQDARRLSAFLEDQYRLDPGELLVGFSGSRASTSSCRSASSSRRAPWRTWPVGGSQRPSRGGSRSRSTAVSMTK